MSLKPFFVLFLSTENAARSVIAETVLNAKGSHRFTARSAGFAPIPEVHPETLALLDKCGYATNRLRSKGWGEFLAVAHMIKVDIIVTLSEEARLNCPVFPHNPLRVHWAIDDPLRAERQDVREWKYRKVLSTLENRVTNLVRGRLPTTPEELFLQFKDVSMVI